MRTQDPRQFYRRRKVACKECGRPATSIALPAGIAVCNLHDDGRTQ